MEGKEGKLKKFKKFFRLFDFFGESFTFRYKDENKQTTVLGGIVCILFYVIAITYFGLKFNPFYKKKNFTLQYYTINLDSTEVLYTKEYSFAFGFGLTVNNKNNNPEIMKYLDIKFEFVNKTKSNKTNEVKKYSKCEEENFPPYVRKSFDDLKINKLECVDLKNLSSLSHIPKGIYTDDEFFYYIISVQLKDNINEELEKSVYDFLINNDCKLQLYYTDITLDLSNHENPGKTFINSMFLQLNPTLIQKKNVFYMKYHLSDDVSLFHFTQDKIENRTFVGFSRVEDYALYMGENRTKYYNASDRSTYAKIYIRADNRKVEVKRRYQDFMEFYADSSGMLLSIFWILGVIFAFYDRIKANHSISKRLFYFEGVKGNKFDQLKLIKELIREKEKLEREKKEEKENQKFIEDNKICTYDIRSLNSKENVDSNQNALKNNFFRRNSNSTLNVETEEIIDKKSSEKKKKSKKTEIIDYTSCIILSIIGSLFCCKTKKYKHKAKLFKNAYEFINEKLDAVFYIRNMIKFELINKIQLENKPILNFLSRPIIYFKNNKIKSKSKNKMNDVKTNISLDISDIVEEKKIDEKKEIDFNQYFEGELYKTAYKLDTNVLNEQITNLILKPDKTPNQKKLIKLLKAHLEGVK